MKIYLDDERPAPAGYTLVKTAVGAMELLGLYKNQKNSFKCVTKISLDHDLGEDWRGTGYEVLLWIERMVVEENYTPPEIVIHTANPVARKKMEAAVQKIEELFAKAQKQSEVKFSNALTPLEKLKLEELNRKLTAIEKIVIQERVLAIKSFQDCEKSPFYKFDDIEFILEVDFMMDESDPDYLEDEDNIICQFSEDHTWSFDGENKTENCEKWRYPEKQCQLFHKLMEHTDVPLAEILKIGEIWFDLHIIKQHYGRNEIL